jgi:hypothetical protein
MMSIGMHAFLSRRGGHSHLPHQSIVSTEAITIPGKTLTPIARPRCTVRWHLLQNNMQRLVDERRLYNGILH